MDESCVVWADALEWVTYGSCGHREVNDSVSTLAGARYWDDDVIMVAIILGTTGTNACYIESVDAIPKLQGSTYQYGKMKLKEFLEAKTKKKVEFISPKDPPKKPKDDSGNAKKKDEPKKDKEKEKTKLPAVSTVALKIRLHCDSRIQRIKQNIYKIKGPI
ncbi:heavy metal-associated isoprenylated plant protein 3-like [Canna indica]|uniref:Heavy metal-associated isoprenylated plant protein 3-like n=1 Tax=Canna indica TaxID=4628 RepID=A0AAQ3JRS9_9LILI|nr:heavy metal-associated isoprenylated plant protein 3-like [Canna indica]